MVQSVGLSELAPHTGYSLMLTPYEIYGEQPGFNFYELKFLCNLGLILPKSNSAKNNFFKNITIKLFWRVDFPLPHGAKPLEARGEATSYIYNTK